MSATRLGSGTGRRGTRAAGAAAALVVAASTAAAPPADAASYPLVAQVVVATLDTGTNPFHPTFRRSERRHPSAYVKGYPRGAKPVPLRLSDDYAADVKASKWPLTGFGATLTYVPGTNIIGALAHRTDQVPIFEPGNTASGHGAAASSQIAGRDLGFSPAAYLVVLDWLAQDGVGPYEAEAELLRWAADQPWIDVIHTNIQNPLPLANRNTPGYPGYADAAQYAVSKGKLVVSAGGNFFAEPTETSPHAGPSGVLVAGANDNCGYTEYSNPDPHVVSDGQRTPAAAGHSYGQVQFNGTSSASPRVAAYAAELIHRLRAVYRHRGGMVNGALVTVHPSNRPRTGPAADGRLTAAELHEAIRKTANPMSHASRFDGGTAVQCAPQVAPGPYAKMGYGEVSEHTIGAAFAVLTGRAPMPQRPDADPQFELSERLRRQLWP